MRDRVLLPKQMVYIIEAYKYEASLCFMLIMTALMFPLLQAWQQAAAPRQFIAGEMQYGAVQSHTVIDPDRKSKPKPIAAPAATISPYRSVNTVWPMGGRVTTEFGVSHRPWQRTHSGIDITSAAPSGSTAVAAFKEGTVSSVVRSSRGLGNHVIVDHGAGFKSVYAHLSYFSAREGQHVYAGEPIGFEGRTGVTTGTHLHFEVLLHDKPVNPRTYITGNP